MDKLIKDIKGLKTIDAVTQVSRTIKTLLKAGDYQRVNEILILFNNENTPISILKTLLIMTKSFKNNSIIKSSRIEIIELLEQKRGSKLV